MTIIHDDVMHWSATYTGPLFHAALLDAPYELREIDEAELDRILAGLEGEAGKKGFMGRGWDGTGLVFRPAFWRAIAKHLHPGGFIVVFGGTLNDDLISLAMRRAGLRRWHKMLAWCQLSGFPKATSISKQVDRAAGAERAVVSEWRTGKAGTLGGKAAYSGLSSEDVRRVEQPATPLAATWEGHRYGLQSLKPLVDPILIFQKPYAGRPVDSIVATGAGAINVTQGRIPTEERWSRNNAVGRNGTFNASGGFVESEPAGRWPPNLALVHDRRCSDVCHEDCPVEAMGRQSGERAGAASNSTGRQAVTYRLGLKTTDIVPGYGDTGTAARMFLNADWMHERLEAADAVYYTPKAPTAEREAGLGGFDAATVNDGRDTPIDNAYQRGETTRRNTHPTVKPVSLCKWLAFLLLPPAEYGPRRLLVPCAGSGSEVLGGLLAGFEEVVGVEKEAKYVEIARARHDWWQTAARRLMTTDVATILEMEEEASTPSLFDLDAA